MSLRANITIIIANPRMVGRSLCAYLPKVNSRKTYFASSIPDHGRGFFVMYTLMVERRQSRPPRGNAILVTKVLLKTLGLDMPLETKARVYSTNGID
jgi:hypothetical protein